MAWVLCSILIIITLIGIFILAERTLTIDISRYSNLLDKFTEPNLYGERLLDLRQRLKVDVGSLPKVRFETAPKPNETIDENDADLVERRHACLNNGWFISPYDEYVNCNEICGVSDGVEYKFVKRKNFMFNNRNLKLGSYCLPTAAAICNQYTSILIYTLNGWRCYPKFRAFNGVGGNKIVACNGILVDHLLGKIYQGQIDPNLVMSDIDERLETGEYRFTCTEKSVDPIYHNLTIEAPIDRLIRLTNVCQMYTPYTKGKNQPNWATGTCDCENRIESVENGPPMNICLPWNPTNMDSRMPNFAVKLMHCLQDWSPNTNNPDTIPCGVSMYDENGNNSDLNVTYKPAVTQIWGDVYDRLVRSGDKRNIVFFSEKQQSSSKPSTVQIEELV